MSLESTLQAHLLLKAPERLPALRLFRRNVIAVKVQERTVHAGIAGQADLYGYIRGKGAVIEIELKGVSTPMSPAQKKWQAWCIEWGVPHVVLRAKKDETVGQTIDRWCEELSSLLAG